MIEIDESRFKKILEGSKEKGLFDGPLTKPDWYDDERFQNGRKYYKNHVAACMFSMVVSLLSGLTFKSLLDVLVYTGKSDEKNKAFWRYNHTGIHVRSWIYSDVWNPNSEGHKSVKQVRLIHKSVAQRITKDLKKENSDKWVSQADLAFTLVGFVGSIVIAPHGFGVTESKDLNDYLFFWRVMGHLHGLKDEFNPFGGSVLSAKRTVYDMAQYCLLPSLINPPEKFESMAKAVSDNYGLLYPFIRYATDLALENNGSYGDPVDESNREVIAKLYPLDSKKAKKQLAVMKWIYQTAYRYTIFRLFFDFLANFHLELIKFRVQLATWWKKKTGRNSLLCM